MVKLGCQLDRILFRHHANRPLSMSLNEYLEWGYWDGKAHPDSRWCHPMHWGPRLHKKGKACWEPAFFCLYTLAVDAVWLVASRSCKHDFCITMDCDPSNPEPQWTHLHCIASTCQRNWCKPWKPPHRFQRSSSRVVEGTDLAVSLRNPAPRSWREHQKHAVRHAAWFCYPLP